MRWVREQPAAWDSDKARIIGGTPVGAFDSRLTSSTDGDLLPGDWWRLVDDDGVVVAYGWMDTNWGDAEILLATDPARRGQGLGSTVLEHLEEEARRRGLNYLTNMVRPTHPDADEVRGWLGRRGFRQSDDGRMLRTATPRD